VRPAEERHDRQRILWGEAYYDIIDQVGLKAVRCSLV
jgi:hypothetical protein